MRNATCENGDRVSEHRLESKPRSSRAFNVFKRSEPKSQIVNKLDQSWLVGSRVSRPPSMTSMLSALLLELDAGYIPTR